MPVVYESAQFSPSDRVALWHESVWRHYVPLDVAVTDVRPFTGQVATDSLGDLRIATARSRPQTIRRTPSLIKASSQAYLMVGVQARGTGVVAQHGREAVLAPGEMAFWDTESPYDIHFPTDWAMTVYQFPRQSFGWSEPTIAATPAVALPTEGTIPRLLGQFLGQLAVTAAAGDQRDNGPLTCRAVDLVGTLVQQALGGAPSARDDLFLARVRAHVDAHLADPALGPTSIAAAHGISVRCLQRLFRPTGQTVTEHIRTRRLEHARHQLANPRSRHRTIAAVARSAGFVDAAHFSRCFRAAYGETPREWCARSCLPGVAGAGPRHGAVTG
jgi:AraC-like DNA-binding protein